MDMWQMKTRMFFFFNMDSIIWNYVINNIWPPAAKFGFSSLCDAIIKTTRVENGSCVISNKLQEKQMFVKK